MRVVAIIQARMGSTRLPGKVLKDLGGETVLARVVKRTRRAILLDEVVVATSVLPADDAIVRECESLKVACFRGDELDVLDRYYRAAQKFAADAIVRITSDCPLIDPELIDATIRSGLDQRADYASNALIEMYPRGLGVEVCTVNALARAWSDGKENYQRTHVTPYLYENQELFKVVSIIGEADYSKYRWTLDTPEDLELIRAIYQHFGNRDSIRWIEVLDLMEARPDLAALNSHVRQKALREG
ncbi:MAG: glycosyltransferase family protein [Terriglobales bacterium]|jgi:spore coat polysaccharide biosynthesis protein SpsF